MIKACFGPWHHICCIRCKTQNCARMVVTTASGKPSHWNIALKLLKEEKEHDGDVSNTIMDNKMFDACENADQQSIELKTLV